MAEVTLDSVTKRYAEEVAVDDVTLTVEDGQVLGVIGPSGCGKTTTLRTIAGFETPTDGRVLFDDEDVTDVPPEDRNVGLVFQSYALFNNMSVIDNVGFGLKMQGVEKTERMERAMELLELVGIEEHADKNPKQLSGGQQQRVGLARALAIEPRILLLDEPMTGLDAKLKTRLEREIGSLLDTLEITALYVTHDQREAMVMCDRIAVMNDGHIEQIGSPEEIYEEPANEFVAEFVGTANVLEGTIHDGQIDLGFAQIATDGLSVSGGDVTIVVRPEGITVGRGPIEAEISEIYYVGETIQATALLPDGQELSIELDKSMGRLSETDTVELDLDPAEIHVLSN